MKEIEQLKIRSNLRSKLFQMHRSIDEEISRFVKFRENLNVERHETSSVRSSSEARRCEPICCLVPRNIHGHYYVSKYHFQPYDYRKLEPSCLRAVLKEENYEKERERDASKEKKGRWRSREAEDELSRGSMPLQNRFLFPPFFYSPFFPPSPPLLVDVKRASGV